MRLPSDVRRMRPGTQTDKRLGLLQDIAAAEEEVTRKGVTVAASKKSAAKLRRDVDKVAAELEALEQQEEDALERHEAAKAASFDHQEAMQVRDRGPKSNLRSLEWTAGLLHQMFATACPIWFMPTRGHGSHEYWPLYRRPQRSSWTARRRATSLWPISTTWSRRCRSPEHCEL